MSDRFSQFSFFTLKLWLRWCSILYCDLNQVSYYPLKVFVTWVSYELGRISNSNEIDSEFDPKSQIRIRGPVSNLIKFDSRI